MAADEEGREGGSEDLFEDLDKFFASIGEGDWPDPLAPNTTCDTERPSSVRRRGCQSALLSPRRATKRPWSVPT